MKQRITSLLLAIVLLLTLCPTAFAVDDGLLTLTIEYYIQNTQTKIAPSYKASLLPGSTYDVSSPAVVGYKVAEGSAQTVSGTLDQDTGVRVDYVLADGDAGYTINYIGRSIDGTEEVRLDTVSGTAAVGEIITAEDKPFSGYVRDAGTLNLQVTGDNNAVLNVYYTEVISPCIVFSTGGDYVEPVVAEAGTDISEITAARDETEPTRQGYEFAGWDWNGDGKLDDNDQPFTSMPADDKVVKAVWTPGTSEYIVEYYFQDTEGDGYTRNDGMDDVRTAATESPVTVTDADIALGETTDQDDPFFGFDYSHCEDAVVTGDGQAILKLYYDREIWSITLHDTPMSNKITYAEYRDEILPNEGDVWLTFKGRYGAPLPDDFPTVEKLTEHYDPLCPDEWKGVEVNNETVDYFYVNMLWPAQSTWDTDKNDGTIIEDGNLDTYHYYANQKFDVEDTPGSHEINLYPCYATGTNVFYINYYLQDLENPDEFTLTWERILIYPYSNLSFSVVDNFEGFTIMGGWYRSKETGKEWPEPGDPPLTYDRIYDVSDLSSSYTFPMSWHETKRDGYTFTGWYSDPELTQKIEYMTMDRDQVAYAGWEANSSNPSDDSDRKYVLHFVTNGGTSYIDKGYDPGTTVTLDNKIPERDGYTFTGWYSDPELQNRITSVTMNRDTAIYAGWRATNPDSPPEESKVYDLHFVLNGGILTSGNPINNATGQWTQVTEWDDSTGAAKLDKKILTTTELHFLRLQYDLSFYSDNQLIAGQTIEDIYYEAPLEQYLSYTPSDELSKGRTFLGWCLSTGDTLDGTDEIVMVDEDMTMPAADVYLHAVWAELPYTVTFDSRGGTPVDSQSVEKGKTAFEPEPPAKDGCTFVGWYDEDGVRWSFDQEITEDVTLYAVWRQEGEASYTVKHIVEGEDEPFSTSNGTGRPGDTVIDRALGKGDAAYEDCVKEHGEVYLLPDVSVKSLTLKEGDDNVIIFYYSPSPTRDYIVHYYLEGTTTSVAPDKIVYDTDLTVVTEAAKELDGYELIPDGLTSGKYQTVELVVGENNEIIFYYKLNEDTAVIAPAPVTIYMGGEGYDGAIDGDGDGLTSTNGFPVPGFTISAPEGVDEDDFDPAEATLKYTNGKDIREWNIVPYDNDEDATHGIYRFEPADPSSATDVRMQFIRADGVVVTEDDFVITDHLDQDLTMEVYGESIEQGYVTLEYGGTSYKVAAGTAQLKVRSTTGQVQYGSIVETEADVEAGKSGIVAPDDTIYYINNNPVKVVNTSAVKLLFDDIIDSYITTGKTNTALLKEKTDEVLDAAIAEGAENVPLTGKGTRRYELKYLDLVDTSNGNVWVAADNTQDYITVYWPLPEGTDSSTGFALLHFPGLHREMGTDEVADDIDQCNVEIKAIEVTETHIKFDVPRAGFSPFVLVWETEDSTPDPNPNPNPDPDPDPGTPLEPVDPPTDSSQPNDPDNPSQPPESGSPDTPTEPGNPGTPSNSRSSGAPSDSGVISPPDSASSGSVTDPGVPKTGDETNLILWLTLAGAALLGLSGTLLIAGRKEG